jgi:hypothetical protein
VTSCRLGHANSGFATAPLPKLLGDRAWGRDCLYDRCCNNIALTLISIVLKLQNLFRLQRFSGVYAATAVSWAVTGVSWATMERKALRIATMILRPVEVSW